MKNPFKWSGSKVKTQSSDEYVGSATFFYSRPVAPVDETQALSIPAIKAAVELISNSISQLPIHLYVENEADQSVEKIKNDPRVNRLNCTANNYDVGQVIKKQIVQDYLLRGKAYVYKKEDGSLHVLPARNVNEEGMTKDYISFIKKTYQYNGMETLWLDDTEVFEINSGTNGLLYDNAQLIQIALNQLDYTDSLLGNAAIPTGILKASSRLTEKAINNLRESWTSLYRGSKNTGKTIILEEGMDYHPLSLSPDKMQMVESQKAIVSEVARIFSIPESMINSHANKYASLEQNNLTFLQSCIGPIITSIEGYLNKNLLTDTEKALGYHFRFKTEEILRTTEKEKMDTIEAAFKSGLLSFNEARHKLHQPKVKDDYYLLSLGSVIKNADTGELTIPNMGVVDNKNNQKEENSTNENGNKNDQSNQSNV
ncbi:phage portal protein [Priestia sp. TRN 1309]|uniref:phage portal protein n=1 Tax=Priestia sp. TRN 1309 TaxID=3420729 RepID=UPI003D778216